MPFLGRSGGWWKKKGRQGLRVGRGVLATANAAYSLATGIAALVNSESKYFDTAIATPSGSTAVFTCLNLIAQGTDVGQRIGNTIRVSNLNIRGQINAIGTTPSYGTHMRIVLFIDRESASASVPLSYTDLFTTSSLVAPFNILNSAGRFKILYDRFITLDLDSRPNFYIKYFKKFTFGGKGRRFGRRKLVYKPSRIGGHLIRFDSASNTLGSTDTGNIWLMYVSDDNTNTPNVEIVSRIRYYDN